MSTKFKIDLRPGTKLSEQFNNHGDCYKVVEIDNVLGYIVSGGSRESAAVIYPLYRADIHMKVGKTWHFVSSYEQGDRLNDYTFHFDYEGCTFATIASQAIRALEERRNVRALVKDDHAKVMRLAHKAEAKKRRVSLRKKKSK
jgi:hypothetical protein